MSEQERAAVTPWDPFRELDFFRGFPRLRGALAEPANRWSPALDVSEDDAHYLITVELAGANRDDVNVEVHDGVLTIRGEKRSEREDKDEHRRVVERSYGSFSRAFTLPANADANHIAATFDNGVLTVDIPKAEAAKPRPISVK